MVCKSVSFQITQGTGYGILSTVSADTIRDMRYRGIRYIKIKKIGRSKKNESFALATIRGIALRKCTSTDQALRAERKQLA